MVKLIDWRALRGANYYSYRPVIVLQVDLEQYDEVFTNTLGGFTDTLIELVPSLEEHRCSEDERGGLIVRMREGTLLGHVIEHVALELQYIAGMEVGFGKTIDSDAPGVYQVIYSYWVEEAGAAAGEYAIEIVNAILEGKAATIDIEGMIRELEDISADHYLGPSTAAIVEEAEHRGITVLRLDDYNLVQLGEGKYQRRIAASITSQTSMIGVETAGNKKLTKHMLDDAGIPVPKGTVVRRLESAVEDAEWLGYPVVVKPHDGHHGKGVTTGISGEADLREAFARAQEISDKVIVEKSYVGHDYRMLVVDGRFVAAAMREPASVSGDGEHTIEELIRLENRNPRRGYGHEKVMTRLSTSAVTQYLLERAGYTLETVLPADEDFRLELTANLSTGGSAADVTDTVHKANRFMAERIASIVGLDIAGIDVIATTLEQPVKKIGGAVIEVNAAPGLRMHLEPAVGRRRNVAAPILDMLFPRGAPHDIGIVAVTGTNGKTTTVRLIAHIMEHAGHSVGMTTTDGIYVRGNLIAEGDMSGPYSAQVVLARPARGLRRARDGPRRHPALGPRLQDRRRGRRAQRAARPPRPAEHPQRRRAGQGQGGRGGGRARGRYDGAQRRRPHVRGDDRVLPRAPDLLLAARHQPGGARPRRPRPHRGDLRAGLHRRARERPPHPGGAHRGHPADDEGPRRVQRPERARRHCRRLCARRGRGPDPPRPALVPALAAADPGAPQPHDHRRRRLPARLRPQPARLQEPDAAGPAPGRSPPHHRLRRGRRPPRRGLRGDLRRARPGVRRRRGVRGRRPARARPGRADGPAGALPHGRRAGRGRHRARAGGAGRHRARLADGAAGRPRVLHDRPRARGHPVAAHVRRAGRRGGAGRRRVRPQAAGAPAETGAAAQTDAPAEGGA